VTSNHDQGRVVSKWGNDTPQWRATSAKLLAILQSTQPGTLYIYRMFTITSQMALSLIMFRFSSEGEELGMKNVPADYKLEDMQDVQTVVSQNSMARITMRIEVIIVGRLQNYWQEYVRPWRAGTFHRLIPFVLQSQDSA
jgi:glycosidase